MKKQKEDKYSIQVKYHSELQWVHLSKMKTNPVAQRMFDQSWADKIFKNFDPDKMQTPHVNFKLGSYNTMDGQHTVAALKRFLGKWEDQTVLCRVYKNLTDKEEALMYLALNTRKAASAYQKFKVELTAEMEMALEIDKIATEQGLCVSNQKVPGGVSCIGTLKKVFIRDGAESLWRALGMAYRAWGDPGLDSKIIEGFGLLCHRYNGVLSSQDATKTLQSLRGGAKGLVQSAELLRMKTGNSKADCVAAAAIAIINRDLPAKKKLPSWWKE